MSMTAEADARPAIVEAPINYVLPISERMKFHAQDHGRDNLRFETHVMKIADARSFAEAPSLEREGIQLVKAPTAVRDYRDPEELKRVYLGEVAELVKRVTGASEVHVLPGGGMVRYAERSEFYRTGMNTQPARFPHVDFTPATSPGLAEDVFGARKLPLRPGQRLVGYNIWRVFSEAPQDVPLAVCDSRSVSPEDLMPADGVYDEGDDRSKWWELEAYVVRHNPRHRWMYFRDMGLDEALMFRSYDNGPTWQAGVPHTAFDDPSCPPGGPARVSVEARAYAVFA